MVVYQYGVDYAFTTINPAQLYAAGKRFAMRYVGPGSASKHLTAAERDALWAAGLSIVLLVEGAVDDPQSGYDVGVAHARQARAAADVLGFPKVPMYFAVDRDENATNWPPAREYLRGADSVLGEGMVGVYGERDVMVWAARDTVAAWYFQAFAWSDYNQDGIVEWYPGNHVEQYRNGVALAGGTVDLCRAMQLNIGQYHPGDDMDDAYLLALHQINWLTAGLVEGKDPILVPAHTAPGGTKYAAQSFPNMLARQIAAISQGPSTGVTQAELDAALVAQDARARAELRDAIADAFEGGAAAERAG
jgi:Domain of unknown function (DUF1906)